MEEGWREIKKSSIEAFVHGYAHDIGICPFPPDEVQAVVLLASSLLYLSWLALGHDFMDLFALFYILYFILSISFYFTYSNPKLQTLQKKKEFC